MHFICSIKLACFLDSALNCLRNDENGNLPPNSSALCIHGEAYQFCFHLVLSDEVNFCLEADALDGRVACSRWGRLVLGLEQPVAVSFASLSAALFPFTLL